MTETVPEICPLDAFQTAKRKPGLCFIDLESSRIVRTRNFLLFGVLQIRFWLSAKPVLNHVNP